MKTSLIILAGLLAGGFSLGAQAVAVSATGVAQAAASATNMPATATANAVAAANATASTTGTGVSTGIGSLTLPQVNIPSITVTVPGFSSQAISQVSAGSPIVLLTFPTQVVKPGTGSGTGTPGGICSSSGQCFTPPPVSGSGSMPGSTPPSGPSGTPGATCVRGGTCPGVTPGQPAIA